MTHGDTAYDFQALTADQLRARGTTKWRHFPVEVLPMFVAEMDFPTCPEIMAALHEHVDRETFGYLAPDRLVELAEATAAFQQKRFGWLVDPDDVFAVPDVMRGVLTALVAFTQPGDGVVICTPVYAPFFEVLDFAGRRRVEIPLTDDGDGPTLDLDAIDDALAAGARAVLLSHPHNPVGREFDVETLTALAQIVGRHGAHVISDEIHSPLVLDGVHHPYAALTEQAAGHTTTLVAASKAWNIAGLKCAQLITSATLRPTVTALPEMMRYGTAQTGIAGTIAAYREGEAWLDELLDVLSINRDTVAERITAWPRVTTQRNTATYLQWIDFGGLSLDEEPARWLLREAQVALNDGASFGGEANRFARLNFGTTTALLRDGLDRIEAAVTALS